MKDWLLVVSVSCAPLLACGGRAHEGERTAGVGTPQGGSGALPAGGGSGAGTPGGSGAGGDAWAPPPSVDPEVSRAWSWEPCGTLAPEAPDREALFDREGQIVVLGQDGVRVHDASGALVSRTKDAPDFLVAAPDGSILGGKASADGVALTPIAESSPRIVLPPAPARDCGARVAFSGDGAYLYTMDGGTACAWRVSDATFAGSASLRAETATVRDGSFLHLEGVGEAGMDIVRNDFAGKELSRVGLGVTGPVVLSPAGDRAVVGENLVDLATGSVVPWKSVPQLPRPPVFSPGGEVILFGDQVFRASDGAHLFSLAPDGSLLDQGSSSLVLSPDGRRAVQTRGRATLFDVEARGVAAVLGPPPLSDAAQPRETSDLAISADGSLLVHNVANHFAFGIRVAPSFGDSQLSWSMRVEINLGVDVTPDGRFAAVGGDGRAVYDARDGHPIWAPGAPPPAVSIDDVCLLDRLRLSPQANWIAGTDYSKELQLFRFDAGQRATPWQPSATLPGHCDAPAFSHDEQLLATSAAALYRWQAAENSWKEVWKSSLPPLTSSDPTEWTQSDAIFSPDEQQLIVSRCLWRSGCVTTLFATATGAITRSIPELDAQHPSFSPDGSWLIAGHELFHLPSGEVRSLGSEADAKSPALFTPNGDIIAGSPNGTLTRYCRRDG